MHEKVPVQAFEKKLIRDRKNGRKYKIFLPFPQLYNPLAVGL